MPQVKLIPNWMQLHRFELIPAKIGDQVVDLIPEGFPLDQCFVVHSGGEVEDRETFLREHSFSKESEDVVLTVMPKTLVGALVFIGKLLLATIISIGIGYAIRALTPPPKPENKETFDNTEGSPTYGWSGIQNTTRNGAPVQIGDGEHMTGGHVLSAYTDVTDDDQHELFLLISLGAGRVGAINGFTEDTSPTNGSGTTWQANTAYAVGDIVRPITRTRWQYVCSTAGTSGASEPSWSTSRYGSTSDGTAAWTTEIGEEGLTGEDIGDGLLINGTQAKLFDGLRVYYRMGSWAQRPLPFFTDTQIEYEPENVPSPLPTGSTGTYTTNDRVDALRFIFQFSSGLYTVNDNGSFGQKSVTFRIRVRPYGGSSWGGWHNATFSAKVRTILVKKFELEHLEPSRYDVQIERSTADDDAYSVSVGSCTGIVEIRYEDVTRKGQALIGIRHAANEQLSGRRPTINSITHGKERVVYQPSDEWGQDTQQDFATGREKLLWGWHCYLGNGNLAKIDYAASHTYGDRTLTCKHAGSDETPITSDPASATPSCPFFYKKINDDFTLTVECDSSSGLTPGDGIGILFMDDDQDEDICFGAVENVAGTLKTRFHVGLFGQTEDEYGTTSHSLPRYLRLVRDGYVWTFSISSDGETFTEIGNTTFKPSADPVRVGVCCYSQTASIGSLRAVWSGFTFSDTTGYSEETTSNPSWVVYGHATDDFWGLGGYIAPVNVDRDTFLDFAAYANGLVENGRGGLERRYRHDFVLDAVGGGWEVLLKILENYKATLLKQGESVKVAWLQERSGLPSQIFCDANTERNSLVITDENPALGFNTYQIQFRNRELDYEQDYVVVTDPDIEQGEAFRSTTDQHYGVVRLSEATRIGGYKVKKSQGQRTVFQLVTGVNALRSEIYNKVEVSGLMMGIGESGRVVGGSASTVTLDKPVTIEASKTYAVKIVHLDDSVEAVTVTNGEGVHSILTIDASSPFNIAPEEEAVWCFGEADIVTKPFELTKVAILGELKVRLEGVVYVGAVYDETIDKLPPLPRYSTLPDPRAFAGDVKYVITTERAEVQQDGSITNVVDVSWRAGSGAVSYDIYYREQGQPAWVFYTNVKGINATIYAQFIAGVTYDVAVVSVAAYGAKKKPGPLADPGVPFDSITIEGKTTRPSDVTNFTVVRVGDSLAFSWTRVSEDDVIGYEIRYADTDVWELEDGAEYLVTAPSTASKADTPVFVGGVTKYFHCRALNSSGLYSENSAGVQYAIPDRDQETTIITRDEASTGIGWNGTKTNFSVDGDDVLQDADTTTATYVTPDGALDAGSSAKRRVRVDLVHAAETPVYSWDNAPFAWNSAIAGAYTWKGPKVGVATVGIEIRFGDSTPLAGDYQTLIQDAWYTGRYFQIRVTATVTSAATRTRLKDMVTYITE